MTPIAQDTQQEKKQEGVKGEPKTVQKKAPDHSTAGQPDSRNAE
jgi:hypothetical protein